MFLLKYLPSWLFYMLFFVSILGLAITNAKAVLQKYRVVFILSMFFSVFMLGVLSNNNYWLEKVKDLELQVAKLETQSQKVNTQVVTKLVTQQKVITEKGQDIVKYIDREVVKYDNTCTIPKEALESINKAATK